MNPKDIARRAKALLEANGDRPIDFHNKNGMAVSSLSRILNAEFKRFPTEQLEKIAKFYGRDISYFTDQNNLVETTLSDTAQGVLAALEQADKNGSLTPSIASGIAQMLRSLTPIAPVDQPLPNETIDAARIDQVPANVVAEDESFLKQQMIKKSSKKSA